MRRLIATFLVVIAILSSAQSALAGGGGGYGGYTPRGPNTGEVAVEAVQEGQASLGVYRAGRNPWADCLFQEIDDPAVIAALLRKPPDQVPTSPQGWWIVLCGGSAMPTGAEVVHLWPRGEGLPPAVRDLLVDAAVDALEVPYLAPQSSPAGTPDRPLITGLETWLWVDPGSWRAVDAQAAIPAATVTATARPVGLAWQPGDGSTTGACRGPGTPWSPAVPAGAEAPCGHRYERTSADSPGGTWPLGVTVRWEVTWSCEPGCGTGQGAPFVLTVTRPVTVEQVQTRLTH